MFKLRFDCVVFTVYILFPVTLYMINWYREWMNLYALFSMAEVITCKPKTNFYIL